MGLCVSLWGSVFVLERTANGRVLSESNFRRGKINLSSPWALILFLFIFLLTLGVVEIELWREVVLMEVVVRLLVLPVLHQAGLNRRSTLKISPFLNTTNITGKAKNNYHQYCNFLFRSKI